MNDDEQMALPKWCVEKYTTDEKRLVSTEVLYANLMHAEAVAHLHRMPQLSNCTYSVRFQGAMAFGEREISTQ